MTSHTLMIYAMAAIAAVLVLIACGLAMAHRRIVRRRIAAGGIDAGAAEQSYEGAHREVVAYEAAADAKA